MGRFWLDRDFHPSLGCTEDDIRRLTGAVFDLDPPPPSAFTGMEADFDTMQVVGIEPGLGFIVTFSRSVWTEDFAGEVSTSKPEVATIYLDPDLNMAFGAYTSCEQD